ncbi:MAG: hypothetical protein JSS99_05340 [Actinobacteria bacterium]|nr:hypothetical protein [Actinomycetota bacterium]
MASAASEAAVASHRGTARAIARGSEDAATAAWLCALPCAAVAAIAIVVLGPPLGRLMTPSPGAFTFLVEELPFIRPEPTEHARYLLALAAPLLGALAIVLAPRWQPRIPVRVAEAGALATQALLAGLVVAATVAQAHRSFGPPYKGGEEHPFHLAYFTTATLVVAGLLAVLALVAMRDARIRRRAASLLRESRGRRWIALAVAAAATAIWLLPAVNSDASIALAPEDLLYHLAFPFDETFAVLNGRTPLADFTAQYSSLWPYVVALSMDVFGKTLLAFTLTLCTIGGLALLAVFGVFRRVTRSSLAALLLFLPFLASSLFLIAESLGRRSTVGTYFGTFPLRYAGPWFVAWLTARLLSRREPPSARALWLLFAAGGLALLNNGDFGVAATGASVAAVLWTAERRDGRALLRLAGLLAAGLATALALVSVLTLVRAGTLPQLGRLVDNRVLTGMLVWAGVFGLGAGTYFVGRSHPVALKHHFSAWAFALALLTVAVTGASATRPFRRIALPALVVLFGFGAMACSLAQAPSPWREADRLEQPFAPIDEWRSANLFVPLAEASARAFVATIADGPSRFVYRHGAPVAILMTLGHRIADAYGVVNVSPYTGIESLQTVQRVERALDALRDAGGNTVILPVILDTSIFPVLERRGFEVLTAAGLRRYVPGQTTPSSHPWPIVGGVMRWVDTRHLRPRALRG